MKRFASDQTVKIRKPYCTLSFSVASDDPLLCATLRAFYRNCLADTRTDAEESALYRMCYSSRDGVFQYQPPEETVREKKTSPSEALICIENLIYLNTCILPSVFALHGAVLAKADKAYLLMGETEAGKSTLTAYLAHRGYEYISDDEIFYSIDQKCILPARKPLQLRDGGRAVLEQAGISLGQRCETVAYGGTNRHLLHFDNITAHPAYRIGGIYFLRRGPQTYLRQVSKFQAFAMIMKGQLVVQCYDRALHETIRKLAAEKIYELGYDTLWTAEKLLEN